MSAFNFIVIFATSGPNTGHMM